MPPGNEAEKGARGTTAEPPTVISGDGGGLDGAANEGRGAMTKNARG